MEPATLSCPGDQTPCSTAWDCMALLSPLSSKRRSLWQTDGFTGSSTGVTAQGIEGERTARSCCPWPTCARPTGSARTPNPAPRYERHECTGVMIGGHPMSWEAHGGLRQPSPAQLVAISFRDPHAMLCADGYLPYTFPLPPSQETPLKCLNACNKRGRCISGWCHCDKGVGGLGGVLLVMHPLHAATTVLNTAS